MSDNPPADPPATPVAVTVDPVREQLVLKALSHGVTVERAVEVATAWVAWIVGAGTDAEQHAREALALQAVGTYSTLAFSQARADDLAAAAAWCVVPA